MNEPKRILFFAEPATLAHVARPTVLASALDPGLADVVFATGPDYRQVPVDAGLTVVDMYSIGTRAYLEAVRKGRPVFSFSTLERYVEDDLRLIREHRPALIVGDLRLSLAVSARLEGVPYWAISNAYWSPLTPVRFDIPVHWTTRLLGVPFAQALFDVFRPMVFAIHSRPMHRLREKYGMRSLGSDLRSVFSEADLTLFADVPEMFPASLSASPGRYAYLGPITWSPSDVLPTGLEALDGSLPLVYVGLGSSGDPRLLGAILKALVDSGCRVVVAAGNGAGDLQVSPNVIVAERVPGALISKAADLVICNGGSPGVHQALQAGTPVLGIPQNLDQMLNMRIIAASGAGLSLRADQVTVERIKRSVRCLLDDDAFRRNARNIADRFSRYSSAEQFSDLLRNLVVRGSS